MRFAYGDSYINKLNEKTLLATFYIESDYSTTNDHIDSVYTEPKKYKRGVNELDLGITFNKNGNKLFTKLTSRSKFIIIIINDKVVEYVGVDGPIPTPHINLSIKTSDKNIEILAAILNEKPLPCRLKINYISE